MVSGTVKKSNARNVSFGVSAIAVTVLAVALLHLGGCASPAYYWQAASGHLALMRARQPVEEAIAIGELDHDTLAKLRLSQQLKTFAVSSMGLPDNNSYSQFVLTGQDAVVWNVVATPKLSLEPERWCFPVSGCVPYRGYFERPAAERFAEKLAARGLDVAVSPAIAYSTLGWFADPLVDTMWRQSDAQFAAYLFHELAHQQLYVEGDAAFNEAFASFVEGVGVRRWLEHLGDTPALQQWRESDRAREQFDRLLDQAVAALREVFASALREDEKLAAKQRIFDHLDEQYRSLVEESWQGRDYFAGWFERPLNNARLALHGTYKGGRCAFAHLFGEADQDMARFHALAEEKSRLPDSQREAWLEQPCSAEPRATSRPRLGQSS